MPFNSSVEGLLAIDLTAAISKLHPPHCAKDSPICQGPTPGQLAFLMAAFGLMIIGAGGVRPCNLAFGTDQFNPTTESGKRGINSFFNWQPNSEMRIPESSSSSLQVMNDQDKMWLELPKSDEYLNGVNAFLGNSFANFALGNEVRCPCKKCHNRQWHCQNVIYDHLICNGHSPMYVEWIYGVSCPNLKNNIVGMDCETSMGFGDDLDAMLHATYQNVVNC